MRLASGIAAAALTAALALTGCAKAHSTATLTAAEQAALPTLEHCVPNGHSIIPAVLSGHAGYYNASQLVVAFRTKASRHTIFHCALPTKAKRDKAANCTLHAAEANGAGPSKVRADVISALDCVAAQS